MAEGDGYILVPGSKQDGDENKNVKLVFVGGAVGVSSLPLEYGPIYENATHKFYGETHNLGAALNTSVWRVSRVTKVDNQLVFADGDANFDNVYTSLAVVEALTYPGGA